MTYTPKLRAYKKFLPKALAYYQYTLQDKYDNKLLSPALIHLIEEDFRKLQNYKKATDPNTIWQVPMKIAFMPERNMFEVVVDDSNVLWLDECDYM